MIGNGKKSKRKRKKQDPCTQLWAERKALYLEKEGGEQEWNTEKDELYCDGTKIAVRPSDDADRPFTDEEIKAAAKKTGSIYATSKDRFKNRPKKKKK